MTSLPVPGARTSSARPIPRPPSGPTTARYRARRSASARATLPVAVENQLAEETTVHWHGMRVPNAMDGVPHLTQQPIAPGETFVYEFDVPTPAPSGITRTSAASSRSGAGCTGR